MSKYQEIVKNCCHNYSLALDDIIKNAKNKKELLKKRTELKQAIKEVFEKEVSGLQEIERNKGFGSDIAEAYMQVYSNSLDEIFEEETKRKNNIFKRREELKRKTTNAYQEDLKKAKTKRNKRLLAGAMAGTLLAGGLFVGQLVDKHIEKESNNNVPTVSDTMPEENEENEMPELKTYKGSSGGTYQYLTNVVDVAYASYAQAVQDIEEYNKNNPNAQIESYLGLIDGSIIAGIQCKESSFELYVEEDQDCKGPFKIGTSAKKDINKLSLKLTGEELIKKDADIDDPIICAKACAYLFQINGMYLDDNDVKVTRDRLVASYLFGANGISRSVKAGENIADYEYASEALGYADVLGNLHQALEKHPEYRDMDGNPAVKEAYKGLEAVRTQTESSTSGSEEME